MALPTLAPNDSGDTETEPGSGRPQPKREHIMLAAVAVVALLAGGWFFFLRSSGDSSTPAPVVHKPVVRVTAATGAAGTAAKPVTGAAAKPVTGTAAKPVTGTAAKPATGTAATGAKTGAAATAATAAGAQGELASYVAKANAVCQAYNVKDKAIDSSDNSIKGQIATLDQELPLSDSTLRQLKALAVPAGHPEFATLWIQQGRINSLGHQYRAALFDGNPNTAIQDMGWALQDNKTLDQQFVTAGLTSCV